MIDNKRQNKQRRKRKIRDIPKSADTPHFTLTTMVHALSQLGLDKDSLQIDKDLQPLYSWLINVGASDEFFKIIVLGWLKKSLGTMKLTRKNSCQIASALNSVLNIQVFKKHDCKTVTAFCKRYGLTKERE